MIDYQATLYGPIYATLGVPATITPGSTASPATVVALDKTAGMTVFGGGVDVESIKPAAVVRVAELAAAGLTRADLVDASILINGSIWEIRSTQPRPSPNGERDGELLLILDGSSRSDVVVTAAGEPVETESGEQIQTGGA